VARRLNDKINLRQRKCEAENKNKAEVGYGVATGKICYGWDKWIGSL